MDETKEIGFLRIIAGNPTLGLDAVDIPKIEQSVAELDCSDITSITKYGLDTQKKMAELSQVMTKGFVQISSRNLSFFFVSH